MVVAGKHILHAVDHHNMARLQGLMERSLKSVAENNKLVGVVVIGLNNTVHKVYEGLHNLTHGQMSGTWSFLAKTWNSFEVGGPTGVMWTGAGFAGGQDDASAGPKEHH